MTETLADRAVEFMFRSPSTSLKVEFQGGEPLLNLHLLKYIVSRVKERNKKEQRQIEFVACSNLESLSDEILDYCLDQDIYLSTSLDGPAPLHNLNRPNPQFDSHAKTAQGILRAIEALGPHKVSALMTTTRESLSQPKEIVDEYLRLGLRSIFVRKINPYGLAARTEALASYTVEEWFEFYKKALDYIIAINDQGVPFREEYASVVLRKLLTPYGTGFVDLQSPAGIGISVIVYNYDGGIYASDESRMLAEMGDDRFRLGDLMSNSFEDVMLSDVLLSALKETILEGVPQCADCALAPFCGADPVRHYRTHGDTIGYKPTSDFCRKNMKVMKYLISLLEDDPKA
jgi:His-Xaa-Ser system radical SAM maturase HxsB